MSGIRGQKKAALIACHLLWRELAAVMAQSNLKIMLIFFEQGLHDQPTRLQQKLQDQIDELDSQYDYILLGYGLCSNGIAGLKTKHARLVVPRAHDCITLLLGSKEHYQSYFDANPGTYWFSQGWLETGSLPSLERLAEKHRQFMDQYADQDTADYLIEEEWRWIHEYHKACLILEPELPANPDHVAELKDFSSQSTRELGWTQDDQVGTLQLFRELVNQPWDPARFLLVEPGFQLEPSFDATIIKAVPDANECL
jgi:hypothetical protein